MSGLNKWQAVAIRCLLIAGAVTPACSGPTATSSGPTTAGGSTGDAPTGHSGTSPPAPSVSCISGADCQTNWPPCTTSASCVNGVCQYQSKCPSDHPTCVGNQCCASSVNTPCACGVHRCDGTCSATQPSNFGQTCGSCGGTIGCDGKCTVVSPANVGNSCGQCGGVVKCDGSCSVVDPPNVGAPCGHCTGKIKCDGTCSVADPANWGAPCGQCGGTIDCSGGCSNNTPRCPPGFNDVAGECRSATETSVHSEDRSIGGTVFNHCNPCGCGLSHDDNISIPCGDGLIQSSHNIRKVKGGNGHCEGEWLNNTDNTDCSVRFHYGTGLCDNFTCRIEVNAVAHRPYCTP